VMVRPAMREGQFPSMFVCPACGMRLTAILEEGTSTAVRCECDNQFVVKLPPARKNRSRFPLPTRGDSDLSSETESCVR